MYINIVQRNADTILLGMGGTLPDLTFDNYFWQKLVPEAWGMRSGATPQEAMEYMRQQYRDVQHMLNWYCLGYWSEQLDLNICTITTETEPHAALCEDTIPFLEVLKASGKQRILLTNTHPYDLVVRPEHTGLDVHLDLLPSTHTFGYPEEDQRLWRAVTEAMDLKTEGTLLVDDSGAILDAAVQFSICHCLGVISPDSGIVEKQYQRHPSLNDHRRLISSLM